MSGIAPSPQPVANTSAVNTATSIQEIGQDIGQISEGFSDVSKPWWQSKGVWGGVIALLCAVLAMFGHRITSYDQATLVDGITGVGVVAGSLVAIIGRFTAKTQLH